MKRLTDDGTTVRPAPDPILPDPVVDPVVEPPVEPEPSPETLAALSVDEVMDRVEDGEWGPVETYEAETAGRQRVTLLRALEAFAAEQ